MTFKVDQRVRMKRTDNSGTVTLVLPGNLVQVKLDGGLGHIPIPAEALELVEPSRPKVAEPPPRPAAQPVSKATLHEDNGIQLAFDPQLSNEAEPVAYEVYLINSTAHKVLFELKTFTHGNRRWSKSGILEPNSKKRLEAVEYRWLNEKLSLELDCRAVTTGGTGPGHFEKVRIKPSQFFGKYVEVPELYREAHLYPIFRSLDPTNSAPASAPTSTTSLQELTRRQIANRPKPAPEKVLTETDVQERLEFSEVLDLHLNALVEDPASVPKHQVLQLQLKTFDDYLAHALRLGVDSVFIIHGVGNGVLKRAIHSRLHHTKFIREFKNEYHHKYGFGATEILFD